MIGMQVFSTPESNSAGEASSDSDRDGADQLLSEMAAASGQLGMQAGSAAGSSLAAAEAVHDW